MSAGVASPARVALPDGRRFHEFAFIKQEICAYTLEYMIISGQIVSDRFY